MTAIRTIWRTIGARLARMGGCTLVAAALLLADLPLALVHASQHVPDGIPEPAVNATAPAADAVSAQPYDPEALPRNPSLQPRLDRLQERAERDSSPDRGTPDPEAVQAMLRLPRPFTAAEAVPPAPACAECRPRRRAYDPAAPPSPAI